MSCDEPKKAFQNWVERGTKFAEWIVSQVKELNFNLLSVDGSKIIEETDLRMIMINLVTFFRIAGL